MRKLIILGAVILALAFVFYIRYYTNIQDKDADAMIIKQYESIVSSSKYMRHALGGLDGQYSYTNSYEALVESYDKGFHLYEVDLNFTSDDVLVLTHGWGKKDYVSKMGISYTEGHIPTYKEFMQYKFHGQFTPMAFKNLVKFMKDHQEIFVMVDLGQVRSYEETKKAYEAILKDANYDNNVLDRLIVGGHNTDMIKAVKDTYNFPLINLYLPASNVIEDSLRDYNDFTSYCHLNGITSFSTSIKVYNDENIGVNMKDSGLIQYVFTINDEKIASATLKSGATIIGTDFLE